MTKTIEEYRNSAKSFCKEKEIPRQNKQTELLKITWNLTKHKFGISNRPLYNDGSFSIPHEKSARMA